MPSSESSPKRLPRQEPGAGQLLAGKRPFFPSFTPEKTFVGPPSPVTTVLSCPQLSFGHVPYLSQLMFSSNSAQGLGDPQASDTVLPPGSSRSSPHSRRVRPPQRGRLLLPSSGLRCGPDALLLPGLPCEATDVSMRSVTKGRDSVDQEMPSSSPGTPALGLVQPGPPGPYTTRSPMAAEKSPATWQPSENEWLHFPSPPVRQSELPQDKGQDKHTWSQKACRQAQPAEEKHMRHPPGHALSCVQAPGSGWDGPTPCLIL